MQIHDVYILGHLLYHLGHIGYVFARGLDEPALMTGIRLAKNLIILYNSNLYSIREQNEKFPISRERENRLG